MKSNIVILCLEPKLADNVGKILAEQLDMYYLNTTELFKFDHIPHTIEEFLQNGGEPEYRKLESGTIKYSSSFFNTVICVDSGVVKTAKNLKKLAESCFFVYVQLTNDFVKKSLNNAVYDNNVIKKFYCVTDNQIETRKNKMVSVADVKIAGTKKSALKICAEIVRELGKM